MATEKMLSVKEVSAILSAGVRSMLNRTSADLPCTSEAGRLTVRCDPAELEAARVQLGLCELAEISAEGQARFALMELERE